MDKRVSQTNENRDGHHYHNRTIAGLMMVMIVVLRVIFVLSAVMFVMMVTM